MSARRKKRINQNSNPEVRDMQAGPSQPPVPEEVPQQESETKPQEDTTDRQEITKIKEATMGNSWKDRLNLDKAAVVRILMAVGISVCIMLIVFFTQGVPKGTYNADMARMEQGITTLGSKVADNTADITDLGSDLATTTGQYTSIAGTVSSHTTSISALGSDIDTVEGNITAMQAELDTLSSPPEGYLTGNFISGNLTMHARASDAGNYTANVHLVFAPMLYAWNIALCADNGTMGELYAGWWALDDFYIYTNITAFTVHPVVGCDDTDCGISQVWWNIGTFALAANTDTDISVLYGGLADTPSFAYVEIYPALK